MLIYSKFFQSCSILSFQSLGAKKRISTIDIDVTQEKNKEQNLKENFERTNKAKEDKNVLEKEDELQVVVKEIKEKEPDKKEKNKKRKKTKKKRNQN